MVKHADVSDLYQYEQKIDNNFKTVQLEFYGPNKAEPSLYIKLIKLSITFLISY
jgi:hypothetical protein